MCPRPTFSPPMDTTGSEDAEPWLTFVISFGSRAHKYHRMGNTSGFSLDNLVHGGLKRLRWMLGLGLGHQKWTNILILMNAFLFDSLWWESALSWRVGIRARVRGFSKPPPDLLNQDGTEKVYLHLIKWPIKWSIWLTDVRMFTFQRSFGRWPLWAPSVVSNVEVGLQR